MENILLTIPRVAQNAYAVFSIVLNILAGLLIVVLCLWMAVGIYNLVLIVVAVLVVLRIITTRFSPELAE